MKFTVQRASWALWAGLILGVFAGCSSSTAHLPKPRPPADDDESPPPAVAAAPNPAATASAPPQVAVAPAVLPATAPPAVMSGPNTASPPANPAATAPAAVAAAPISNLSELDRRKFVIDQMRQLARALEAYRERNSEYPSRVFGLGGQLSWRVQLLPFLGQRDLYLKFNVREPWDGPTNKPLLAQIPKVFQAPGRLDERTNMLLVTGPSTAYATSAGVGEICRDGFENTIFLVEASDELAQPWTKPNDYEFVQATAQRDLFSLHKDCCFAILGAKSEVRRLKANISDQNLLALLSPAGGENINLAETAIYAYPEVEQDLIAALEKQPLERFGANAAKPAVAGAPAAAPAAPAATVASAPRTALESPAGAAAPAAASNAQLAPPEANALAEASARAKEIFGAEYADAKRADQKRAFAQKMLTEGDKMAADKMGAFVLYRSARDVAARAGDVETALTAIDKMAALFRVDLLALKTKALEQAAPVITGDSERGRLADAAFELVDLALRADDFNTASQLLTLAGGAAKHADSTERALLVAAKQEEVQHVRAAYSRVSQQVHALLRDPNDPAANTAVGMYCCFVKRDWPRGLELLARGNDPRLAQLAQRERAASATAEALVELGDAWWDLSEELRAELERTSVRQHAATWYEQALPKLSASLAKARVEKRIGEAKATSSSVRTAENRSPR